MSDTERRPYAQVYRVATCLVEALRPHCHRIEIAGSLRRQKETIGDIEIVAIPVLHTNLIGDPLNTSEVDDWLAAKPVTLHKNGPKYKAFSFDWQPGWPFYVDLFLQPDPATWGVNMLIRTGSSDFSHKMMVPKVQGGYKPEGIEIRDARLWRYGVLMETPNEEDVFRFYDMKFIQPMDRL